MLPAEKGVKVILLLTTKRAVYNTEHDHRPLVLKQTLDEALPAENILSIEKVKNPCLRA